MNLNRIAKALKKFIGVHDFRNFCKKDESMKLDDEGFGEEQNFIRRIYNFEIEPVHINQENEKLSIWVCIIRGSAFLWH